MQINEGLVKFDSFSTAMVGENLIEEERKLLGSLLADDTIGIDLVIPENTTPRQLRDTLNVCAKVHGRLTKAGMRLKPIIGRLLVIMQKDKKLCKEFGYDSFDKFVSEAIPELTGMARSEAYQCKRIVEHFPSVTLKDFEDIGYVKMGLLCNVTEETAPSKDKWFDKARELSVDKFRTQMANNGGVSPEDINMETVSFTTTRAIAKNFKRFMQDPLIQAYVGSTDVGHIIDAMIGETEVQWMAMAREQMQ